MTEMLTLSELIEHYDGETLLCFNGQGYSILDIQFSTVSQGSDFAARAATYGNVDSVQHIANAPDNTVLYSVYVAI